MALNQVHLHGGELPDRNFQKSPSKFLSLGWPGTGLAELRPSDVKNSKFLKKFFWKLKNF